MYIEHSYQTFSSSHIQSHIIYEFSKRCEHCLSSNYITLNRKIFLILIRINRFLLRESYFDWWIKNMLIFLTELNNVSIKCLCHLKFMPVHLEKYVYVFYWKNYNFWTLVVVKRIERICLLSFFFLKLERMLKDKKKTWKQLLGFRNKRKNFVNRIVLIRVCIDCAWHNAEDVDKVNEFRHGGEKVAHHRRGIRHRRQHWRLW